MLQLYSPAKINLFLRVLAVRDDAYHELASLFQTVNLGDDILFDLAVKDTFSSSNKMLAMDESNLIIQALQLFRKTTKIDHPVKIELRKNIPMQAGLGGGNSNAATTLWGLNELFSKPLSSGQLLELSKQIGSDTTFFFSKGSAYCTGRGEKILNIDHLPEMSLWLIKPKESLSTKAIFTHLNLNALSNHPPLNLLKGFLNGSPVFINDLEKPAFQVLPVLKALKEELSALGYQHIMMTGSGTALFCMGRKKPPEHPDRTIFKIRFIKRNENEWYQKEEQYV